MALQDELDWIGCIMLEAEKKGESAAFYKTLIRMVKDRQKLWRTGFTLDEVGKLITSGDCLIQFIEKQAANAE